MLVGNFISNGGGAFSFLKNFFVTNFGIGLILVFVDDEFKSPELKSYLN